MPLHFLAHSSFSYFLSQNWQMESISHCISSTFFCHYISLFRQPSVLLRTHVIRLDPPGKSDGWKSLVGCSTWGHWGSDTTERLHFHFSLSCIGEGNGNPLQCSCLENPRDGGAWRAAIYGVAQSRTWLKWLSSNPHNPGLFLQLMISNLNHGLPRWP